MLFPKFVPMKVVKPMNQMLQAGIWTQKLTGCIKNALNKGDGI